MGDALTHVHTVVCLWKWETARGNPFSFLTGSWVLDLGWSLGSRCLDLCPIHSAVLNMQILEDFIKNSASPGSSDGVARHSLNISPISFKSVLCERLLGGLGDEMWCSAKLALDTEVFFFSFLLHCCKFPDIPLQIHHAHVDSPPHGCQKLCF